MKKLLLLLLCVLPFIGYAQNDVATNFVSSPDPSYKGLKPKAKTYLDQVFANAIEGDDGRLCAKIDVKKKIKYDDIVAYINDQNTHTTVTIMGNNATMTGVRLDPHDPKAIVTTVLFLKKGDYKNYALKKLAKCAKSKEVTNGTNADAYICFPNEDNQTQVFTKNNVVWNGNSSNGKISGRGQGYYYNNGTIIYFNGYFVDGYPSYPLRCHFFQYTINEDELFQGNKVKDKSAMVQDFDENLAAFWTSDYDFYGFINQDGKIVIKRQYTEVVEPFHDGKAVVYDDQRHSNIIINTNGDLVDYDEKYIYENKINGRPSYSQLTSVGKGMFFNDLYIGTLINNFKWSGEVVNGMINGNGSGYAKNGKDYYYVSGTFVNGFPNGTVVFKKLTLTSDDLNNAKYDNCDLIFEELSEGMAFVKTSMSNYYSLVNEQGKCIALSKYRKVLKPFENGYAEVVRDDDKEIVIDKNGEFVDYTAYQKGHDEAERKAEEAKRIEEEKQRKAEEAKRIEEEKRRIAEEKAAEQARIAAEKAEKKKLAARVVTVDLGLPFGTLWADRNIGADSPEDYGDYFAWGETTSKSNYGWSTYKYAKGDDKSLTKYSKHSICGYAGYTDSRTQLESSDDAATANWGSNWCMPTALQFEELYHECTWTWTSRNGKEGYEVKGPNGNSIFLPAAGIRYDSKDDGVGGGGYYWSSWLFQGNSSAGQYLQFLDLKNWIRPKESADRSLGFSVRPVRRK